ICTDPDHTRPLRASVHQYVLASERAFVVPRPPRHPPACAFESSNPLSPDSSRPPAAVPARSSTLRSQGLAGPKRAFALPTSIERPASTVGQRLESSGSSRAAPDHPGAPDAWQREELMGLHGPHTTLGL